jgi:hypothetical protein
MVLCAISKSDPLKLTLSLNDTCPHLLDNSSLRKINLAAVLRCRDINTIQEHSTAEKLPVGAFSHTNNCIPACWIQQRRENYFALKCKWGLVHKREVDDFLNVLRWSKYFGVDTPEGRQLKQGVTGVFAGSAFKQDENVLVNGQPISLAACANRLNITLLKAADFNEKLHEHGCKRDLTIQKICNAARDEK